MNGSIEDIDLLNEIKWVMRYYGSDAGERENPGSKLQAQAERIAKFVDQRNEAYELLRQHGLHLLTVISSTPHKE